MELEKVTGITLLGADSDSPHDHRPLIMSNIKGLHDDGLLGETHT